LRKSKMILPTYANEFRCIGSLCDDTCCVGWLVEIDQETYEKYQTLPAGPLRTQLDESVRRTPDQADGAKAKTFATIQMSHSHECPMHNAEGLCQIQVEHGATYLSRTCSTFPRMNFLVDGMKLETLSLSCPEAARIALTSFELTNSNRAEASDFVWDDDLGKFAPMRSYFWPIREFTVSLLQDRSYALWQRMFLLGSFCRRLEAVARNEVPGGYSAMENGFSGAVSKGSLRESIQTIPAHNVHQLHMVTELIRSRVVNAAVSARYMECANAFLKGIGGESATTLEEQSAAYAEAYERFYMPFFFKHPRLLENLLINMVFRSSFPFGQDLFTPESEVQPTRQFAFLVTEFALIKGMLIGVAGFHKEAFSVEHVVQTVQVIVKYFEHNPLFLTHSLEMLTEKGLNNAEGLTMLLRN
jgi:lysine-N-methylase